MKMSRLRSKKGFTLIELVVVMIILAILAAIIIPQLSNFSSAAERSTCHANQRILDSTTAMWRAQDIQNNRVPTLADMIPMIATDIFCPSGGTYAFDAPSGMWQCSLPDHSR